MNPDVRNMLLALVFIALCAAVVVVIKTMANWRERRRIQANEVFSTRKGWTSPSVTPNASSSLAETGHRGAVDDILPSLFLMGAVHQAFGGEEDSREKLLGNSNRDYPVPGNGSWSGQADTHYDSSSSCSDSDSQSSYDSGSDACSSDSSASFSD